MLRGAWHRSMSLGVFAGCGVALAALIVVCSLAAVPGAARTITVGSSACNYIRIQDAVDAAEPGDTILVRAGIYEEAVEFRDGVVLQGADRDEVTIRTHGRPVITASDVRSGRISGLTLERTDADSGCTVWLVSATLELSGNVITGAAYAGIEIRDAGANPVIEGNLIRSNGESGIFVHSSAGGTIRNNEVYENGSCGVYIEDGADPLVEGNTIRSNTQSGIYVRGITEGAIRNNEVYESGSSGIAISEDANPLTEGNVVRNNTRYGIHVHGNAEGTIRDNEVYENGYSGIAIGEDANPLIEGNVVRNNTQCGIVVYGSAEGTIRENEIHANGHSGVCIAEDAAPLVEVNVVRDNMSSGVYVYGRGKGVIRDNEIYENGSSGIQIKEDANPLIESNVVRNNTASGIFVYGSAEGTIRENVISGNGFSGIRVKDTAAPLVEGNVVRDNAEHGIYVLGHAGGTIGENTIVDNQGFGMRIEEDASPTVEDNTVSENGSGEIWFGAAQPPQIVVVGFPELILTGTESAGTMAFRDANGNLAQARFEVLEGPWEGIALDLTQPPYAEQVADRFEGEFGFELRIEQPGRYRLRATLVDATDLSSEPVEFSFDAVSPTPPVITRVVFPSAVAVDREQHGIVRFEDAGGDVIQVRFEILDGDPATVEIRPGMSFDPQVRGQTDGVLRFTVRASHAQSVEIRVILLDEAGIESEPYEFAFEVN